jgi:Tfp pilus assembly protein PilF
VNEFDMMKSQVFSTLAIWLLLGSLLSSCAGLSSLKSPSANDRPSEAVIRLDDLRKTDPKTAISQIEAYLRKNDRDDFAWTILGHAHEALDQDQQAMQAYEKALSINPKRHQALTAQGILYRKQGKYDQAMAVYEKAIAIDANSADAYSSMAVIALKQKQDAKALEYAEKAYQLDDQEPTIAANLAMSYHYNGKLKERDRMTEVAANLGYTRISTLKQVYRGELTIRD